MATTTPRPPKRRSAPIVLAIALLNFVLLLFPPLTWFLGHGAVWYFLITGIIGVLSVIAMYLVDDSAEEDR